MNFHKSTYLRRNVLGLFARRMRSKFPRSFAMLLRMSGFPDFEQEARVIGFGDHPIEGLQSGSRARVQPHCPSSGANSCLDIAKVQSTLRNVDHRQMFVSLVHISREARSLVEALEGVTVLSGPDERDAKVVPDQRLNLGVAELAGDF